MKNQIRLTRKSNINTNGLTGVIISTYRIKMFFACLKVSSLRNSLFFFDAGFNFGGK